MRGNKPGEWRYWGADAWSSRYSALDQINATNFDSLQVAWQLGRVVRTATTSTIARRRSTRTARLFTVATTRRKAFAIDPATGTDALAVGPRRRHSLAEGAAPVRRPRPRRTGPTAPNERVIVVTPGYHLAIIDAKTGKGDPKVGKDGVVDLMEGLGFPLVPLAVDDTDPLEISEAYPARKAKPGEKWDAGDEDRRRRHDRHRSGRTVRSPTQLARRSSSAT